MVRTRRTNVQDHGESSQSQGPSITQDPGQSSQSRARFESTIKVPPHEHRSCLAITNVRIIFFSYYFLESMFICRNCVPMIIY